MSIEAVLAGESRWCLLNADCAEILPTLPTGCVNHVITDPPYSKHTHGNMRGNRGEAGIVTRDPGFEHLKPALRRLVASESARIATGWIAVFSDWESVTWWRMSIEAGGGSYRRCIPWVRWSSPQFNGMAPPSGSEAVVIAKPRTKGRKWLTGNRTHYDTPCLRWHNKAGHPTEKPVPLFEEILSDVSLPGDVIIDPFCGSGASLLAAIRMGRRAIGLEINPEHYKLALTRLQAEEEYSSVAAVNAGQTALFQK